MDQTDQNSMDHAAKGVGVQAPSDDLVESQHTLQLDGKQIPLI